MGRQSKPNRSKVTKYLTKDQTKHIHKKVESGSIINIGTVKQEIDQDWSIR